MRRLVQPHDANSNKISRVGDAMKVNVLMCQELEMSRKRLELARQRLEETSMCYY
jgi:hypothetical protein